MGTGFLGNNVIAQVGIVVRDIEKSSREFAEFFGIPVPTWVQTDPRDKAQTRTMMRVKQPPVRPPLS